MIIRYCEFCGNVLRDEPDHCPVCGAQLMQEVSEEQFSDPANPWPFAPVNQLCLQIQGQPRIIRFSGTHSVFHLWDRLYCEYDAMQLCYRIRKDEMELSGFLKGGCPEGFRILEPGVLLNCKHRKFSFSTWEEVDPELADEAGELENTYHGSFEIEDCPPKQWGNVLGWLVATPPRPAIENHWTYDI